MRRRGQVKSRRSMRIKLNGQNKTARKHVLYGQKRLKVVKQVKMNGFGDSMSTFLKIKSKQSRNENKSLVDQNFKYKFWR